MTPARSYQTKYGLIIFFFVCLALYALFQARFLILGPKIAIESPRDGSSVQEGLIVMEGRARNVSWISLNGRQIFTDENGYWSEKLLVSEGLSTMTVSAKDRFGRETEKAVRVVLN